MFSPAPSLTLRTIGGVLDFYFIAGNDGRPEEVMRQYHSVNELRILFRNYYELIFDFFFL